MKSKRCLGAQRLADSPVDLVETALRFYPACSFRADPTSRLDDGLQNSIEILFLQFAGNRSEDNWLVMGDSVS